MHPELVKLLDLQDKDLALLDVDQRLQAVMEEVETLDQIVREAEARVELAGRAVQDGLRRRDEVEAKVDTYRKLQEGRRKRLEVTRPGKETAPLMAELDLARQVLAREEAEWMRAAESVVSLEARVAEAERAVEALRGEQASPREELAARTAQLGADRAAKFEVREASAAHIEKSLRARYDRLRRSRAPRAVVPLAGDACGACYTAVPMNRRSLIRNGTVIEGCEACGVILYVPTDVS
jgi:predicted  nucleic acid-binding Zn-ribbon protein